MYNVDDYQIGRTYTNGWMVSTVKMPDVSLGYAYETMIFPIDENNDVISWMDVYCDRYRDEGPAHVGHAKAVTWANDHNHDDGSLIDEDFDEGEEDYAGYNEWRDDYYGPEKDYLP